MKQFYKVLLYKTEGTGLAPEEAWLARNGIKDIRLVRLDGPYEDFLREAKDADAITVAYTPITCGVMQAAPRLKVVTTHSIGINQVDLQAASEMGIYVANAPDYCIEDVAMHTVALFLDSVRKISRLNRSVLAGEWNVYAGGEMHRVGGKVFGFVSFGNIPRAVHKLLLPFGLSFIAYDPYVEDAVFSQCGVMRASALEALFRQCDFISVHTPYSPDTHHLINEDILRHAKDGAMLFSVGRGGVVDETALRNALLSGKIAEAGIDVIEDEVNVQTVLRGLDRVTITPHAAYYSEESIIEVREKALQQICQVLLEKIPPTHLVNRNVLSHARCHDGSNNEIM